MGVAAVRTPAEYESRLQRYLFERSEEGRAVRVGEKDVSERAAIVARYADLFTREQLEALRAAEARAPAGDERERLYRLRKTCEGGLIAADLSATFNDERLEVLRAGEALEAEVSGIADPIERTEEEKSISLRELERRLVEASSAVEGVYARLRETWIERLLGPEREALPSSSHVAYLR